LSEKKWNHEACHEEHADEWDAPNDFNEDCANGAHNLELAAPTQCQGNANRGCQQD